MKKILIANRGEIARRVIRTAHAMGLKTVAVFSEPDAKALHVREASQAYALGGSHSTQNYLRVDLLLAAARATGADAIHPGYGFLSENADFAQAVIDAGLCWIGPPPAAIRALGSKAAAKALAAAQGVPCLPGYAGQDQSEACFAEQAQQVGYPVMVKAVAGGGGRGMRLVSSADQLSAALASARSEALASFGDGNLLIERALVNPRHVEVQVFADTLGHCIHLGERDCSVQRRHQKIIEEAPSPAVNAALRQRMGACAVALAQGAGYVGAGTVEFLLEGDNFYLMEMNTRLQVEHPVTEAVTGLDLVEWQLRVARGEPLPLQQEQVSFEGHAIEVRLCAEDEHFRPHTGQVLKWIEPAASHFVGSGSGGLRFDHALEEGSVVSPFYDAMLGKLVAHASTREQAIERLCTGLNETVLLGLPVNRAFLSACLEHPQFRAGQALIPFLNTEAVKVREALMRREQDLAAKCWPAALLGSASHAELPCRFARPVRMRYREAVQSLAVQPLGAGQWLLHDAAGDERKLTLNLQSSGAWFCQVDTVAQQVQVARVGPMRWHLQAQGVDLWLEDASFEPAQRGPGAASAAELRAPFNGKVVNVLAQPGQSHAAGSALVVIESMKLEHSLAAPTPVQVADILVSVGQQVSPGQVLLRFGPLPQGVEG
jgi:3-methylcrotonyl-CoA carboxylase alpha subunit/geranyl-CoA carboxylase alpha subunit